MNNRPASVGGGAGDSGRQAPSASSLPPRALTLLNSTAALLDDAAASAAKSGCARDARVVTDLYLACHSLLSAYEALVDEEVA
jgi:hypothetical protein